MGKPGEVEVRGDKDECHHETGKNASLKQEQHKDVTPVANDPATCRDGHCCKEEGLLKRWFQKAGPSKKEGQ